MQYNTQSQGSGNLHESVAVHIELKNAMKPNIDASIDFELCWSDVQVVGCFLQS